MLKFLRENSDNLFLRGITFIFLGAAIFLGATPHGQKPNNPGEAWMLAVPFVAAGASFLTFRWFLQR